jgi:hypothetical protein
MVVLFKNTFITKRVKLQQTTCISLNIMNEENTDEIVIENLAVSLDRVKTMVQILYDRNTLSFEKVSKLARVAKFRLKQVSEEPKLTELAFASLEEVADFLISCIL